MSNSVEKYAKNASEHLLDTVRFLLSYKVEFYDFHPDGLKDETKLDPGHLKLWNEMQVKAEQTGLVSYHNVYKKTLPDEELQTNVLKQVQADFTTWLKGFESKHRSRLRALAKPFLKGFAEAGGLKNFVTVAAIALVSFKWFSPSQKS